MKRTIILPLIILFSVLSNMIWSQTDSLKIDKAKPDIWYLGFGGGPNIRGGSVVLSFTFASSDYWGGSLNLRGGLIKLADVPDDYGGQFGRLPPYDEFTVLSFNLLKKFSIPEKSFRFGFETGPSWVRYNLTELELNPLYPNLFEYKYNKINTIKSTFGVSLTAKAEFPFFRLFGCELAIFTVINKLRSVLGLNICLSLGKVRK